MAKLLAVRMGDVIDEDELASCGGEAAARCLPLYDSAITPFRPYLDQRLRWAMLHEARKRRRRRLDPEQGCPAVFAVRYRDTVPNQVRHGALDGEKPSVSLLEVATAPITVGRWCTSGDLSEAAMAPGESAEEFALRGCRARRVREVVATLKPRLRAVVARHYFEGRSFADIARELGLTRSAVCRRHQQALRSLSKRLHGRV